MELAEEMQGLRFYSVGRVAANKKRGSYLIEVVPVQKLPHLSKEVTDHVEKMNVKTEGNEDTDAFEIEAETSATEQAEWLPWGQTNRITAPDVRRGEYVLLLKFADAEIIHWIELKAAHILRRLETVTWIFSNEREEDKPLTENNVYTITVSTHDKHISITTTKSDGEPFAYTLQLNTKDGHFVLQDDVGNYIFLDSQNRRIRMENRDKSFVDIDKRAIKMEAIDLVSIKTKKFLVDASDTIDFKTRAYSAVTSTYKIKGETTIDGSQHVTGNVKFDGDHHTSGHSTEAGGSSGPNNNR